MQDAFAAAVAFGVCGQQKFGYIGLLLEVLAAGQKQGGGIGGGKIQYFAFS